MQVILDTRNLNAGAPELSMIVPVFNVAPYVRECLESIRANSLDVMLELIIIDDGSTDGSHEVIESMLHDGAWPPLAYVRQANQGLSAVRNYGVALARGTYLGFLDSDDRIVSGALRRMIDYAQCGGCDLILGRTQIFDSGTGELSAFYDTAFWDLLIGGNPVSFTNALQSPELLSLEPNANYRLISRQFYGGAALSFPEGLYFEDAAVHLRMLLRAKVIALYGGDYYQYRVNRPGKITEERSRRRFDVLQVCTLALNELKEANVTPAQGGAALRGLFRLTWGCGIMTIEGQRHEFFTQAADIFGAQVPWAWMTAYLRHHLMDLRHVVLGLLLTGSGDRVLADFSAKRWPLLELVRFGIHFLFNLPGRARS